LVPESEKPSPAVAIIVAATEASTAIVIQEKICRLLNRILYSILFNTL